MDPKPPRTDQPVAWIGRYAMFEEIARGGMASVHLGRLQGPAGFSKTVAIKQMLGGIAQDPKFLRMFLDEARVLGRVQHPNVVSIFDVIAEGNAAYLVMEYVDGESLGALNRALAERGTALAPSIAAHIVRDALYGLHAAHEATSEKGEPLELVHRDVSPQNILVGADGVARVLDFGVAKAVGRLQDTDTGQIKGKVSYMAPEQLLGHAVDHRADIYAAGVVLWETLTGKRLFGASSSTEAMYRVLEVPVPRLSELLPNLPSSLVEAVARATAKDPRQRFDSALAFAGAIEGSLALIPNHVVGRWVRDVAGAKLLERRERVRAVEAVVIPPDAAVSQLVLDSPSPTSTPFARAQPDEVTRADAPITLATGRQRAPRTPWLRWSAAAAVALVAVAWWWPRHRAPQSLPAREALPAASVTLTVGSAPVAVPTQVAPTASAEPSTRAKPRAAKPAAKPAPPSLPRPESLFSRQ